MRIEKNQETWLSIEDTAEDKRKNMPFRKTYQYDGDYIDSFHNWIALSPLHEFGMINIGIDGWLFPADALKLYELAYFSGDILELGTYKGLSTTIIAGAVKNSGRSRPIVSVDLDKNLTDLAREGLEARKVGGRENVHLFTADATEAVRNSARENRKYSFVFVDHSHRYEHVKEVCESLKGAMKPGGFVLFHDYNDPRNMAREVSDYGVYQGVTDGLPKDFEFHGIFGCTGLFRLQS